MNDVNYLKQNGLCFNCFVGSHHSSQCDKPVKRVEVAQHLTNQRVFVGTEPIVQDQEIFAEMPYGSLYQTSQLSCQLQSSVAFIPLC
jgi:hypothetical protein